MLLAIKQNSTIEITPLQNLKKVVLKMVYQEYFTCYKYIFDSFK